MGNSGWGPGTAPVGDRELVGWALDASRPQRRKRALELIAERYLRDVLVTTARRMGDAEAAADVTQQTFADAVEKLLNGEGPANPDHLGGWLYKFSLNRQRNHFKQRERDRNRSAAADAYGGGFGAGVDRVGVARDDEKRLVQTRRVAGRVGRTLAADEQEIYRLYYEQELSVAEVTERLALAGGKLSQKTVQNKVTRIAAVVAVGFEAYLLVEHDRTLCGRLTAIVGQYPREFGSDLRDHVLKHARKCADCGSCAVCPTCRVRDVLAIAACERSAACQRCRVCDSERLGLKAAWAPALVVLLFVRPVRTAVLQSVNQAWSAAISVLRSPPTNPPADPPGGAPGPPSAVGPLRRSAVKAATAAVATAAVVVGALLITRPDAAPSPSTAPIAATVPTIAYATDKGVHVLTKGKTTTVGSVEPGSTVTDLVWTADHRHLGWLSRSSQSTATVLHSADPATARTHTWTCQDCDGLAFQGTNLVSVRQHGQILSYPSTGQAPKTLELQGIDTTDTALQLFLVGGTAADSELLVFALDNNVGGSDANKLYRMAANSTVTTVVDDVLPDIPGGDRAPGQYAAVSPDGRMFAYGGNIAGGDPCTPSDTATVVDLDTGTHTTTALPGGDRSTPLRITGVWFGPHDEVEAGVFTQPAEVCTAGTSARRQPTAVYRLEDGVWTPSGQNAAMARTTAHGWSARRAADAGLTDFRPPASPLVVSDAKNRELRLGDSVTAFAWAPADTTPDPVLGTLWAPYQKGYGLARPTMVYNGGSPAGMVRDVKWTSWGGERATGTGQSVYTPDGVAVADGTWEESTVVAFDLGNCEGTRTYRKIVWFLPKRGGRFDPTHYIDVCAGKFWNSP